MSAQATRDDLLSVVTELTEAAATQREWQAEYEAKALVARRQADERYVGTGEIQDRTVESLMARFAAQAKGTAHGFEVSADMISKYVGVEP
jgi:hypothetical protein